MPWKRPSRCEIVHIVVTGYQKKKDPRKHYVFVIDITWNNSQRFEIYRRYSDFFSFQTTLKALFPAAAGKKSKTDPRVIPQLPKRIFVGRSHVAKVAEARLEQINRYCQTLISLEPKISESVHVIGFFSPRNTDKQLPKLHLHRPASLHPQKVPAGSLFEDYCALAEYQAEDESQISFKAGDKIMVMSKDDSGWWMCSADGGTVGWAPPSYLKKCDKPAEGDSDSDEEYLGLPESYATSKGKDSDDSGVGDHDTENSSIASSVIKGFKVPEIEVEEYKAIDSYEAEGPGQVSFEEGNTIHVLDKMEDGWWFVSNGSEEGWAPCSYLENTHGGDEEEITISSLDIQKYIALEDYKAEEDDELSFTKGITMDVLQKRLDGWWLIKHHSKVGLAPATFLKKVTGDVPQSSESGDEPLFRKVNVTAAPIQPEFKITYQQPPRKQSVRYRASLKNKMSTEPKQDNKKLSPLAKSQTRPLSPIPAAATSDPPSPARGRLNPPIPNRPPQRNASPISSDSEPETQERRQNRVVTPRSPRMIKKGLQSRIRQFEQRRGSESSSMSDNSNPSTPTKPEIIPRKTSTPEIYPPVFKKLQAKSHSVDEVSSDKKKVTEGPPPRTPQRPYKPAGIPLITEDLLQDQNSEPNRPPRPRGSEIRRAKERSRSTSPNPFKMMNTLSEDIDSDASSIISASSRSSKESEISSRGSPHGKPRRQHNSKSIAETSSPSLLPPPVPRRKSTSDSESVQLDEVGVAPPLSAPPQRPNSTSNPLNQQMADTLIKYILASEDPALKSALRQIVTSNPEAMQAIQVESQEDTRKGEGPPLPPQRPY